MLPFSEFPSMVAIDRFGCILIIVNLMIVRTTLKLIPRTVNMILSPCKIPIYTMSIPSIIFRFFFENLFINKIISLINKFQKKW